MTKVDQLRQLLHLEAQKGLSISDLLYLSQKLDKEIYKEMLERMPLVKKRDANFLKYQLEEH